MFEIIPENTIPLLESAAEELLNANALHEKLFLPSLGIENTSYFSTLLCSMLHFGGIHLVYIYIWRNISSDGLMPSLSEHERILKKK